MRIFAEIVDASTMSVSAVLERANALARSGADVIDLGCLPDTPFDHLEETIAALKAAGLKVSVDSADVSELARAARSGADHLLSLDEHSLEILPDGSKIVPILVANPHGDLGSLQRAAKLARARGIESFSIRFSIQFISASPPRSGGTSSCVGASRKPKS